MRTFSCLTMHEDEPAPTMSLVLAADEARARELAIRELLRSPQAVAVEVRENGKLLFAHRVAIERASRQRVRAVG